MYSVKTVLTATAAALLVLAAPAAAVPAAPIAAAHSPASSAAPRPCDGAPTCYVDVAVAQVWVSPEQVRPVDAPATTNPADVRGWLAGMSLDERREVAGETQALHGIRVTVDRSEWHGGLLWDHVWVHGQPTPRDEAGRGAYPGWIPDRQLTSEHRRPPAGTHEERVARPTARGFSTARAALAGRGSGQVGEYSYNTSFPVEAGPVPGVVTAHSPSGGRVFFRAGDLARVPSASSGADVVAAARAFLGLPYLWSGTSGFGYDCSGLTSQVYSALGVTIPRDAQPQFDAGGGQVPAGSAAGVRITGTADLRLGDIVAFRPATGTQVTHVGIYSGTRNGEPMMINSPRTGDPVKEEPIGSSGRVYVGATRFLTR
ncbi:NlpC/P60 family protein [Streptomyces sp. RerS4]|uniref:C40 family peptidase n=1 Tax=Streptomyces sp. RerS4 TaxID=2942449 RepID=UPI00201C540D|nr:NlpC/P60 family protein [Streptomyces sp. RerS4]UQW99430.1 C40 family peptidase [Streptomyces sp. RerS4]